MNKIGSQIRPELPSTHTHILKGNLSTVRASEFSEKEVQSTFDEIK